MNEKKKKTIAVIGLLGVILLTALIMLLWESKIRGFVTNPEILRGWVEEKGFIAQLVYVVMTIFQVIIAIIPGEPFEVCAGYAFGAVEGTILALIGTVLGGIVVFLMVKKFGIKLVKIFFPEEKINSLSFIKTNRKKSILYFIIFMIPGTPKDLLCYFAGLTDMKLSLWILITVFGRIPSIITSTIGGNLLGTKNYINAIIVFIATMIACIIGITIYYAITERNKKV